MPKAHTTYQTVQYIAGKITSKTDEVTIEKALQISLNGNHFAVVMQTPGDEINLTRGLLFSEDIIAQKQACQFETKLDQNGFIEEVNCIVAPEQLGEGYTTSRSLLSVSSCGICGKKDLQDLKMDGQRLTSNHLDANFIFDLQLKMQQNQPVFPITGSTHGAALFNEQGELLTLKEDIGRHNALDKAIGELIAQQYLTSAKILFFSGRLSFEIIFKSFRAKIGTIIAVSAPSSLAIDYAKEFGIVLYGFCRNQRFTRYS